MTWFAKFGSAAEAGASIADCQPVIIQRPFKSITLSRSSIEAKRSFPIWLYHAFIAILVRDRTWPESTLLQDQWAEHFQWRGAELAGRTAIGRVTIRVLGMNEPDFLEVRLALIREGALQF